MNESSCEKLRKQFKLCVFSIQRDQSQNLDCTQLVFCNFEELVKLAILNWPIPLSDSDIFQRNRQQDSGIGQRSIINKKDIRKYKIAIAVFLLFEIRKNLDLRKVLGVTNIFLKSKFGYNYYLLPKIFCGKPSL